jgi:large subunit ribosomal protein LP1
MKDEINALIKDADFNVESFWPGLFPKALANIKIERFICHLGAGAPGSAAGAMPAGSPDSSTTNVPVEERKVEAKNEEPKESVDDIGCLS